MSESRRIAVLGKTGAGKSSLANTVFGKNVFKADHSSRSGTTECKAESKSVRGVPITWVDTPGVFDTKRSEEEMKAEIVTCITECAPGPHAFLIVLKVEKYTEHERQVIERLCQYFSEVALSYSIVLFTHGDQLSEGTRIEEFVDQNKELSDLVKKCGGRCHVFDNKYWNKSQDEYRNNEFQVAELLKTIDRMIKENKEGCYTNEMLQACDREIQQEEEHLKQSSANMTPEKITLEAKTIVSGNLLHKFAGFSAREMLGTFLGRAKNFLKEPLGTADKISEEKKGECYTNQMLQARDREVQQEKKHIKQSSANMTPEKTTRPAKTGKALRTVACGTTGAVLGGLLIDGAMKSVEEERSTVALAVGVALGAAAGIAIGAKWNRGSNSKSNR